MATFEILTAPNQKKWAQVVLTSISLVCNSVNTAEYVGDCDWLVVCGWGGPFSQAAFHQHRAKGKPVLVLDAAYLSRNKQSFRISVNSFHPGNQIKFAPVDTRFYKYQIPLIDTYNPEGHILLLGITPKSCVAYNYRMFEWEIEQIAKIKKLYGNRQIVYRPKPMSPAEIPNTIDGSKGTIEQWLRNCAVALVHHSNVANDCAIHNIPCVATDGVGTAIYPSVLTNPPLLLTQQQRLTYLKQVAWFTWEINEVTEMLKFAQQLEEKIR